MGLFPDPKCTRCNRIRAACICARSPQKAIKRQPPREKRKR